MVVPVSTEVDEIRATDPPDANTEVVWANFNPTPVVRAVSVSKARVAAVAPEDERSNKVPVVVEVSTEVDESLAREPPLAMTDVV